MEQFKTDFRIHSAHDTLKHALLSYSDQLKSVHDADGELAIKAYKGTFQRAARVIWGSESYMDRHAVNLEKDLIAVTPVRGSDESYRTDSIGLHRIQYKGLVEMAVLATGLSRGLTFKLVPTEENDTGVTSDSIFERAKKVKERIAQREHDTFFAPGCELYMVDEADDECKKATAQQFGRRTWNDFRNTYSVHKAYVNETIQSPEDMFPVTSKRRSRFDFLNRLIVLAAGAQKPQDLVINFPIIEAM